MRSTNISGCQGVMMATSITLPVQLHIRFNTLKSSLVLSLMLLVSSVGCFLLNWRYVSY